MDRRRRKLTVKKMMRRMKSRKIHSRKRSAGETGMEEKIREVIDNHNDVEDAKPCFLLIIVNEENPK
ncbi:hypothetical protein Bca52824_048760 [Brassica carinata]|uniref:Uncharacterized protein n=1 Tax=Brassica carinata TaxID=52824 RepID=A0A8X7UTJ1_BRACI|nr:hypothetical protein Bca52824_048760 [Brassica carinata]